jgi:hypothetical protein
VETKQVIEDLAAEELLVILHELIDDNPEANNMLRDIYQRVEELRKLDHFRQI